MEQLIRCTRKPLFVFVFVSFLCGNLFSQTNAWINEIHYDNTGTDANETIEIVIENTGTLSDYEVFLYNGSNGQYYENETLDSFIVGTSYGNFSVYTWQPPSFQNGPDGIALVYQNTTVIQFLSYDGSFTASSGPSNGLTSIDIGVTEGSSNLPTESLQLSGTGAQYSNFIWNTPATSTFGSVNTGQSLSGNSGPVILNITQTPTVGNITSSDAVSVSTDVTDSDGVASVSLNWGLASGNLTNTIAMSLGTGNTYTTNSNIPAQANGATVYYEITATDSNATPASNTSAEHDYTVMAPQPKGLQISATDTPYIIDFDTSIPNVNNGQFTGIGFQQVPPAGQLDSNSWAITGMSDGDLPFDGTNNIGDYARGQSSGGIGTGGIYTFETSSEDYSLGVQSGGNDFTPGTITLKIQNQTGTPLTSLTIGYDIFVYNDEQYSNSFNFNHSQDNITYTNEPSLDFASTETADTNPVWGKYNRSISLTGLSIAPGGFYYLQWSGDDISGSGGRDEFALDNIEIIANQVVINYVYNGTNWSPTDPSGVSAADDNITVQNGTTSLTADTQANNLTIDAGATLNIEQALILNGNITNNGSIVFANDATKLGQLGQFSGSISGTGEVTVQRYIPGRRAFRFISSAVTTTTNIHDNWQEGAVSNTDNPNPGFGTHITGSTVDQQNGFDGTATGNPSLLTFDNSTQLWKNIPNTDVLTLNAGTAYNLFVRGDRSIDLTTNMPTPTNTVIRASGDLAVGNYSNSSLSQVAGGFNFIGNPYQAIANMNDVLENSTNLNDTYYYVWDPTQATRGAYVLINLPLGTPTPSGSDANQFLQPGQAAFVTTLANGSASILFEEQDKAVTATPTDVFKSFATASIDLVMYESGAFASGEPAADGLLVKFAPGENNAIDYKDAVKFFNPDENVGMEISGDFFIMENRNMPAQNEVLQLYNNNYRHIGYVYKIEVNGLDNLNVYLNDAYLSTQTQLLAGTNLINFSVDPNIDASLAEDRFSIVFKKLSIEEESLVGFELYPNPVSNGAFIISAPDLAGKNVQVALYDFLGRKVYDEKVNFGIGNQAEVKINQLQTGIYMIRLDAGSKKSFTQKLIVE